MQDNAVGAADLIGQHAGLFLKKFLPRIVFEFDELADHLEEAVEDLAFRLAEGCLVGNLEKVAQGFRALAIESADGETELVDRLDDLVDLFAEDKAGKMEHGGGAHTRADIRRAGSEVAEGGRKGEFEFVLEGCVEFVGGLPGFEKMEAGAEGLKADVVLLVDHD